MPRQKTRIRKTFTDHGFGFPVVLVGVPMLQVRSKWIPHINQKKYADAVLEAMASKPVRLTGNEIKFIRHKFEMTLQEFARRFGQKSHQAVMKWEDFGSKPTSMLWPTEKDIRLAAIRLIHRSAKEFVDTYERLQKEVPCKSGEPLVILANRSLA